MPARRGGEIVVVPGLQPEVVRVESVRAQCRRPGPRSSRSEDLDVRSKEIPFPDARPADRAGQ